MKAVIYQAFGHIFGLNAYGFFKVAQIQNTLVCHQAAVAGVQRGEVVAQFMADVIGTQNSDLRGALEGVCAHHAAVHPTDGQYRCVAQRCCRYSAHHTVNAAGGVAWQERR